MRSLSDGDGTVRAYPAEALGRLKSRDAVDGLIELLGDRDRLARREAAVALVRIGEFRGIDATMNWLADAGMFDRRSVRRSLAAEGWEFS